MTVFITAYHMVKKLVDNEACVAVALAAADTAETGTAAYVLYSTASLLRSP
jgi:hypothetical protein